MFYWANVCSWSVVATAFASYVCPICKPIFLLSPSNSIPYSSFPSPTKSTTFSPRLPLVFACFCIHTWPRPYSCHSLLQMTWAVFPSHSLHCMPRTVPPPDVCWALWRNRTTERQLGIISNDQPQIGTQTGWAIWIGCLIPTSTHKSTLPLPDDPALDVTPQCSQQTPAVQMYLNLYQPSFSFL